MTNGLDGRLPSAPWLLDHVPYAPFMEERTTHPPGLSPMDPAAWTVKDADFAAQCAWRDRLIAERPEVVLAFDPRGREAAAELLEALLAEYCTKGAERAGPDRIRRADGVVVPVDGENPMATIGRLGAEDWCVLTEGDDGEYVLAAAALCFPARWRLADKIGRPLTVIHDPVPDYDEQLARRVNRVFTALRLDRPVYRVNWIVYTTPEPHLPRGLAEKTHETVDGDGSLYFRSERQTLVRLPGTGAVIFGIKTSITPLDRLTATEARALRVAFAGLSPETVVYRCGGPPLHRRILSSLAEIAGQGEPA